MALKLITPPEAEPVSLADAKAHMRIDTGDDDVMISALITAARQEAEKITRRALITQTWELVLDSFPCEFHLPYPTLQSVESIKHLDTDGVEQTLSAAHYLVDADTEPARVVPAYGQVWPSTINQIAAVRIRYIAGYGDADTDIPTAIKQWIMIKVATLYENREATAPIKLEATPFVDGLLDEYRIVRW